MVGTYRHPSWDSYRMDMRDPFREVEPPEREEVVVEEALGLLVEAGILPHARYDSEKFLAHRRAVAEHFDIPWTAITPRMQRLIYAVNAVVQPQNMIAAGVFYGNTFISNAGAAVGPGACYTAQNLVGVEIKPQEAALAERNVRRLDPTGVARVIAADAVDVAAEFPEPIQLLYLDADGAGRRGKGVYLNILEACYEKLPPGAVILAHNSVNCEEMLRDYLEFVRTSGKLRASINVIFDGEGLEVSGR